MPTRVDIVLDFESPYASVSLHFGSLKARIVSHDVILVTWSSLCREMESVMGASRESSLVRVVEGLRKAVGEKEIPCSLLYDDRGSELYEQITELEEYYPFRVEQCRLKHHADEIASAIPEDSVIVELGCGTARKSSIVLTAVQKLRARCKYVGIDVSASFLSEARSNLVAQGIAPECIEMVEGEYMQGLKQVRAMHPTANMCIMWLGSSVGNFSDEGAIQFFRDISSAVGTRCQIFLCADMWKDKAKLYAAYHDKLGVTELFIKNGMRCALSLLDHTTTPPEEASWLYSVVVNQSLRRVEMYLTFTSPFSLPSHNIHIQQNERILVEVSRKFTIGDFNRLANEAGFHIDVAWRDRIWGMQMLIPFRETLERCWALTDGFFASVPDWCEKPIDVRHPFKFYYGHIQAFAKLKLRPEEGASAMDVMFSRGIDPNVVDPTKCHSHPEVPSEWPSRGEIEAYVQRTRSKLLTSVTRGETAARLIIVALEHEYMHLETLAYMRAQHRKATFEKKMRSKNSSSPSLQLPNGALAYKNGTTTTTTTNGISNCAHHSTSNGPNYSSISNGSHQSFSNGAHQTSSNGQHHQRSNGANQSVSNGQHHQSPNGAHQTSSNGANPSISNGHHQTSPNGSNHSSNGHHQSISNGANHSISNGAHKMAISTNGAANGTKSHNINDESMVSIPAGTVTLGCDPLSGTFLWDNEYPQCQASIPSAFTVARTPVTIAEYLTFIKSNGYNQPQHWKPLDFDFFTRRNITIPATWSHINNDYYIHTSTTSHHWSSVANKPVYTSLSEAEAYCSWKNGRVMTEAEYHMILEHEDDDDGDGGRDGVQMMRSGGWEWTSTPFEGFAGFEKMSEYPEYSSDFFDGSHFVLKGASDVTHRCMRRDSFRNFYQRQYPYVFAKFRVCRTVAA